jgi:hypothetical protein
MAIRIVSTSVSPLVILAMVERGRAALDLGEPMVGRRVRGRRDPAAGAGQGGAGCRARRPGPHARGARDSLDLAPRAGL